MLLKKNRLSVLFIILVLTVGLMLNTGLVSAASGNLSWGSNGSEVSKVQQTLNNWGYWCGDVDGIFGSKTYNAVIKFQRNNGIQATGVVGPVTKEAMGIASTEVSRGGISLRGRTVTMIATGYDNSWKSNYPFYGAPSFIGLPLTRGIIATDPNVIPMRTKMYVKGYGEGIAADQGNAIKGNRIDLFFDSTKEALDWGIRAVEVTIY